MTQPTASQHQRTMASQPDQGPIQPTASQHRRTMASQPDQGPIHVTVFKLMFKSPKKNDKTSRNYLYFTCHQYDNRYIKKTISVSRHFWYIHPSLLYIQVTFHKQLKLESQLFADKNCLHRINCTDKDLTIKSPFWCSWRVTHFTSVGWRLIVKCATVTRPHLQRSRNSMSALIQQK